jgi:CheY-like chemotaxis protein
MTGKVLAGKVKTIQMEKENNNTAYTVFVVEDSDVYRSILVHALEEGKKKDMYDFKVMDFPSGEKCLQYLYLRPDIIVLDHYLNGSGFINNMDGLSILSRIRRFCPGTDVVIMSCQENIEVVKQFMRQGVKDYIKKEETGPQKVRSAVLELLRKRRQRRNMNRLVRYAAAMIISGLMYWLI